MDFSEQKAIRTKRILINLTFNRSLNNVKNVLKLIIKIVQKKYVK